MRWKLRLILSIQAVLVVLLAVGIRSGRMPLGIRGEWEWVRLDHSVNPLWQTLVVSAAGVAGYAAFVGMGLRALSGRPARWSEASWLAALWVVAIAVQVAVPIGAPYGYGLTKWALVNYLPGSSGYFRIAQDQAAQDPWRFLARYPEWIQSQDSLHIGTHPPGLIVAQCILLRVMARNPSLTDFLNDRMPQSVEAGFRSLDAPIRRPERATLYATGLLTLLACAGTVVPLFLLARAAVPAPVAWIAAALWPLAPAANLFQPDADTTYPLLSTMAWALAAWAARRHRGTGRISATALGLAAVSGTVMAFGLMFTLAFLPVGLIVGLIIACDRSVPLGARGALIAAAGAGLFAFVLPGWITTGANPFVVWSWNLHHHARFYDEYPRTYSLWLWANVIELAIAIGLPTIVWFLVGLTAPRTVPRVVWCTLVVLVLVNLTGKNMGEVARLWMLFAPPLLIAAARGLERLGGGPLTLAASCALVGVQTLALQAMIQVVYPAV
jgi:hypothetical protein